MKKRDLALATAKRQGFQCAICNYLIKVSNYWGSAYWYLEGINSENAMVAHLHHKDKNHNNNGVDNLQILCFRCHIRLHKYQSKPQIPMRLK